MLNLKEEALKIGITLDDTKLNQFEYYYKKLIEVNSYMNLTAITECDEVYIKHFIDSLYALNVIDKNNSYTICDVGSGAGFPGIPLAIADNNAKVTIIDSLQKRINFLNDLVKDLKLTNVEAFHFRAEEYAIDHKEYFDFATARAVARLNVLTELCLPLVKVGGYFIAMKANLDEEYNEALSSINKLGGKVEKVIDYELPYDMGKRKIILIKKIKETPKGYPRRFSEIKRNPL